MAGSMSIVRKDGREQSDNATRQVVVLGVGVEHKTSAWDEHSGRGDEALSSDVQALPVCCVVVVV